MGRQGELSDSFLQAAVFFAGATRDGSGGYLAFGPGYGSGGTHGATGTIEKPMASADFFPNMEKIADKSVYAAVNFMGATYFAGQFLRATQMPAYHVASFDGIELRTLGGGADGVINTLKVFGNQMVIGGGFKRVVQPLSSQNMDSNNPSEVLYTGGLAAWDGQEWRRIGELPLEGILSSLVVNGSRLFVGGKFNDAERRNNLAVFDGTRWASICSTLNGACGVSGGVVHAVVVDGSDLYVGGSFLSAGEVKAHRIARYDGYHWYSLGSFDANVNALSISNGVLFAGGDFKMHDGVEYNHIARYHAGRWHGLGQGVGGTVWTLAAMSSCIFVGGAFTTVDGQSQFAQVPFQNAARWCLDPFSGDSSWEPVDWTVKEVGTCYSIGEVPPGLHLNEG